MPVASACRRCTIQLPTSFIRREVARSVMSWWMANGVCAVAHSYVVRKQRWHGLTADGPNLPWAADHERAIATRMRAACVVASMVVGHEAISSATASASATLAGGYDSIAAAYRRRLASAIAPVQHDHLLGPQAANRPGQRW